MTPERFKQLRFKHKISGAWNRILTSEINECLDEIEKLQIENRKTKEDFIRKFEDRLIDVSNFID